MNDASSSSSSPGRPLRSAGAERARRARQRAGIAASVVAGVAVVYAVVQAWLHYNQYRHREGDKAALLESDPSIDPATFAAFDSIQSDLIRSAVTYVVVAILFAVAAAIVWRGKMWMLITTSAACAAGFVLMVIFGVRQGESPLYLLPWLMLTPAVLMLAWLPWFFSNTNEL